MARLGDLLAYRFADERLLQRALTHRSFSADHNERLEFLGDSVLGLAISSLLYARLGDASEGELSRLRANLVKQDSLHRVATRLRLADGLRLGEGELRSGGLQRPSILADAFEAVVGAVYLDAGYGAAEALVHRLFADVDISASTAALDKDAKTALQEWLQARKMALPTYTVAGTQGAAHQQLFLVDCQVAALGLCWRGQGASRRAAEQDAARQALQQLGTPGSTPATVVRKKTVRAAAAADPARPVLGLRKPFQS